MIRLLEERGPIARYPFPFSGEVLFGLMSKRGFNLIIQLFFLIELEKQYLVAVQFQFIFAPCSIYF